MAEYNNPGWENNSQHSDHSGDSLDNHLCLFEDWPAWKQKEHLARCCPICQDPYTAEDIDEDGNGELDLEEFEVLLERFGIFEDLMHVAK